jgi:hypothetical protein
MMEISNNTRDILAQILKLLKLSLRKKRWEVMPNLSKRLERIEKILLDVIDDELLVIVDYGDIPFRDKNKGETYEQYKDYLDSVGVGYLSHC